MIRIFRHYISTAYLGLMALEWLVFYLSMQWGAAVRFLYTASWYSKEQMILASLVYSGVFVLCCSSIGLYRKTLDREEYNLLERINYRPRVDAGAKCVDFRNHFFIYWRFADPLFFLSLH